MRIGDADLLAYVDGELPQAMYAEVEREIHGSTEVAARIELLQVSHLAYAEIFGRQILPPLPASLAGRIDYLIREHQRGNVSSTNPRHTSRTSLKDGRWLRLARSVRTPFVVSTSRLRVGLLGAHANFRSLAAAFSAGVVCCGVAMTLYLAEHAKGDHPLSMASTSSASPWIAAAAEYQALYTRDTVELVQPDLRVTAATIDDVNNEDKLAMQVPDLRSMGLTFKRVQRLEFDGKPLVQIVYLPEKGPPVALCVRKEGLADTAPASYNVNGMEVVSWQREKLGYALLIKDNGVSVGGLAKAIYEANSVSVIRPPRS
jgi:anti-sigma factor RsiW